LKSEELEARVKALEAVVQTKVKGLEARVQATEDIEAIKKLQNAYGYYLEHWQTDEILGLWSHSPEVSFEVNDTGEFKGWEAVQTCFDFAIHFTVYNGANKAPGEFLHIIPPLAGIVDLEPDGKTAKGRWYGFCLLAQRREGELQSLIAMGIWENEFIKEDGIWKIKKVFYNEIFTSPLDKGWVKKPTTPNYPLKVKPPPNPNTHVLTYPSGYIFPYHYKNPVTGK
jgi:hypothetical protein